MKVITAIMLIKIQLSIIRIRKIPIASDTSSNNHNNNNSFSPPQGSLRDAGLARGSWCRRGRESHRPAGLLTHDIAY